MQIQFLNCNGMVVFTAGGDVIPRVGESVSFTPFAVPNKVTATVNVVEIDYDDHIAYVHVGTMHKIIQ